VKILFLGPPQSLVFDYLIYKENTIDTKEPITISWVKDMKIDFIVSHGYRHKIGADIITYMSRRIINLHISYLPWNRGADPNLWSFIDDTPKGCTIHYVDAGIDTGDIICQKKVVFDPKDKHDLSSSYEHLNRVLLELLKDNWNMIINGNVNGIKQTGSGSYHKSSDKEPIMPLLSSRWETPIEEVERIGISIKRGNS